MLLGQNEAAETIIIITLLRIFIDRVLELEDSAVITFLDLTNAFGSVSQKFLDEALGDANASDKSRAIPRAIIIQEGTCKGQSQRRRRRTHPHGVIPH